MVGRETIYQVYKKYVKTKKRLHKKKTLTRQRETETISSKC